MNARTTLSILAALAIGITSNLFAEGNGGGGKTRKRPVRDHAREKAHDGDGPGTRDPGVNRRQDNQGDRVAQGVRSGQLTKDEVKSLAEQRKSIREEEKAYKSDGTLTKDERKDLHQDLNATSKSIYGEKHDADTQPGVKPAEPGKAGTKDPGVNARQKTQRERIAEGLKNGTLTKEEAKKLIEEEKALRKQEQEYKSDGTMTVDERKDMHQDLNSTSKDIYSEKHDDENRTKTTTSE